LLPTGLGSSSSCSHQYLGAVYAGLFVVVFQLRSFLRFPIRLFYSHLQALKPRALLFGADISLRTKLPPLITGASTTGWLPIHHDTVVRVSTGPDG